MSKDTDWYGLSDNELYVLCFGKKQEEQKPIVPAVIPVHAAGDLVQIDGYRNVYKVLGFHLTYDLENTVTKKKYSSISHHVHKYEPPKTKFVFRCATYFDIVKMKLGFKVAVQYTADTLVFEGKTASEIYEMSGKTFAKDFFDEVKC